MKTAVIAATTASGSTDCRSRCRQAKKRPTAIPATTGSRSVWPKYLAVQ
jgi:hypothetical protein